MKRILVIAVVLVGVAFSYAYWQQRHDGTKNLDQATNSVIQQAERYKPTSICGQALTPAVHAKTGTKYTFPSTCLPEGWVVETSNP